MKDEARERRRNLMWGIPASLILHVLVATLLVYGLPVPPQQPREEQPVNVAIVPPPDQPKPKPVSPAPKPPEPKVEKPPEQKVEKQPPSEKQPKAPPVEVLKPVFQYGDKDTGPRKSLDGASAQDSSPSPAKDDDSKPPVVPKPADSQPVTPPDSEQQAASSTEMDKQQAAKQEPDKQAALDDAKQQGAAPAPLAADSGGEIELPTSAEAPKPKPANAPKPSLSKALKSASRNDSGLPGVRRLYSQGATGDALATTSMGGVPRGQRAAKLCASALQQELLDASYFPKWVPSIPLKVGNILDAPDVAFSTTTTWYHLSFRCEVDTDATKVVSFNFRVGAPIPPSEWAALRLPSPY
ncbi:MULTISPECIES: DUF930 domain-containing protein [Mesorhizobium]|uniref:DUF930 domain-containing protein n=2 Tax=Mesorhizobium TaxID=68287 RepID=A0A1A5JNF0_RHILI|nr:MULTISPECIES: DUF930 domain-containing protein [Mesorhizobium]MBE1707103.1 DUF930 domain-containing protein [Mesorhizobium japonicum]MBE1715998.1 DUF930 domain-containing protein [Mesorhizobium japonicum]MUT20676.1 DUF930 domain-containing protein [Mesorhizobium japonicum]MUT28132.1 DUF930 domain-containing protein [Mesorhizobium japonicum]OBP81238.1 hypothetical protein BAE42_05175 [Mesorhizobium loti]